MPTGYTSDLYEGKEQSFEEFALQCARAFGALIEMRDEAPGASIPDEFAPSDHHRRGLDEAKAKLADLSALRDDDWALCEVASRQNRTAEYAAAVERAAAMRARYEAMLVQVEAWEPPTQEHQGLRDFMLQQLRESIKFDCSTRYLTEPEVQSVDEFRAQELAAAQWSVDYHAEGWAKEQERAASRTAWVRALRASLAAVKAGA
ncbi:hypothetical protein [Glaciibacter superstes]|uniref:hypothetical protein n=1 Tax=Glaciibacter superstes TaxID=501023 RepID=UPI0003B698ED|nr:hypothetical protein [Glaciibacter superstes]